jgi:putative phosphoserine phosphatase/1-acylglycerol-3-phosphate O-acyltransferase
VTHTPLRDHLMSIENAIPEKPVVAFFDLDRTLIAGYSIVAMAWERARHGLAQGELRQSMKILRDVIRQTNDKKGGKSADS